MLDFLHDYFVLPEGGEFEVSECEIYPPWEVFPVDIPDWALHTIHPHSVKELIDKCNSQN